LVGIKWANKSCKKLAEKIFDQTTFFTTGYFVEEEKKISSFSGISVFFLFLTSDFFPQNEKRNPYL